MCFLNNLKTLVFLAFLKMSVYFVLLADLIRAGFTPHNVKKPILQYVQ